MFKTGPQAVAFPENLQIEFVSEGPIAVIEVDENGEQKRILASGMQGLRMRTLSPFNGIVNVPEGHHWSADTKEIRPYHDPTDPLPVEVPEELKKKITLEDKLKGFLAQIVAERYGEESEEMETFEESMDFDVDEDEEPLSGYEVRDMQDVVPEEPPAPESGPPAEPEPEVEPPEPK